MNIKVFYDEVNYRIKSWKKLKRILDNIALSCDKKTGDLIIVITNDSKLKDINIKFLKHNYYTDVITFNYCEGNIVNGEIYVSVDTVRENALNYKVSLKEEINRVVIHGMLHLVGFNDKLRRDRIIMKSKEDYWLAELQE